MASTRELQPLITEPREDLAAEYKGWLNLESEKHKATLVKAAIALANHGGGHIVIGFAEQDGSLGLQPRPVDIPDITQDLVNSAIRRYAEPRFHCDVYKVQHPDTNVAHPVVIVPGTLTVPVMSRRECQGVINQNRCYIRKSGPESEEPRTSEEWRALFNRCLRAHQDEMLEANRSIITERVDTQNSIPNALDDLRKYCTAAHNRWKELVSDEPDSSSARFPHGYYEMAFSLVDAIPANGLVELRDRLSVASRIKLSGWTPFLDMQVAGWDPYVHEGSVEAWLGRPNDDGRPRESYLCDFWRASLDGKLYTIRGYLEDRRDSPGGKFLDLASPILRIGEGLLFTSRFAEEFDGVDQISMHCRFTGLNGRRLHKDYSGLFVHIDHTSHTDEDILTGQITLQQVQDNLAKVLHPLLQGLYEKFKFYQLPFEFVVEELENLRSGRY